MFERFVLVSKFQFISAQEQWVQDIKTNACIYLRMCLRYYNQGDVTAV